jgi:hypothetical protein
MTFELPLINGGNWGLDLIPIVVDTIDRHEGFSKQELRNFLRDRFLAKFVKKHEGKWITVQGRILETEEELRIHIDWTWMDQFAIPICKNFDILTIAPDRYRLTANGERLGKAIGKVGFEDAVRNVIIQVDSSKWKALSLLRENGPLTGGELKITLTKEGVVVRKDDHLKKYMTFMKAIGLVRVTERHPLTYEVDETRYVRSSKIEKYKPFEAISNLGFISELYKAYQKRIESKSPYVDIDDLRPAVSLKLDWPEEYFDRKLKEIPLRVERYQVLFSQAAFPRPRGLERNGQYFNYLSIYLRE